MRFFPLDQRSRRPFPAPPAPRWRIALLLFGAVAGGGLPAATRATTAEDLCAPTDDPCVVKTVISVDAGSVIDLGTRGLEIAGRGALSVGSGDMTVRAGAVTVDSGGGLLARGGNTNPGGTISVGAGTITLNGPVDASGAPGGTLTAGSTGSLIVAALIDVHSRTVADGGGNLRVLSGDVTIANGASIDATGGGDDSGGDVAITSVGPLTIDGRVDASGGDGGSVTLTSAGDLTVGANVPVLADATGTGGDGGDISATAMGGDVNLGGTLSAIGRNGTAQDSAGNGGTISLQGSAVRMMTTAARMTVAAGIPDGIGGDIDLTSVDAEIETRGQMVASGPGVDGTGGTVSIDAAGDAAIAGLIDVSGGSSDGGDLGVSSGADLTIAAGASLTVAASSSGDGGSIELSAGNAATVSGSLTADGGTAVGGEGGSIDVGGCTVVIDTSGRLSSLRSGGVNTLTGNDRTSVLGLLRADASGHNVIRFAGSDYAPSIAGNAQINPPVELVQDTAVIPCNPVNTPPPGTPVPGTCIGDCDSTHTVSIANIILGVNIALGTQPLAACQAFDADGSGAVTVNELIQGINNALTGCN